MPQPLAGITVIAMEQAIAAPFATRQLADLGARVIKIERPGVGDFARDYDHRVNGLSSHFVWSNRAKESVTLDLKHPAASEILHRLLAHADVFVQNLAPGAAARLGFGAAQLVARYPRLIACDVSGYGGDGPYRDKKAYDLLVQCESGLLSITGTPEEPVKVGISAADIATGMYIYSGVLTALLQRERTGQGVAFEVSMFEALGEWMGYPAYYTAYGGTPPPRSGARHAVIVPYGPFAAGDGKLVFLSIQNEREWQRFCSEVLERPDLASDPRYAANALRVEHREDIHAAIDAVFGTLSAAEVVARLDRAQIANARLNDMQEFWDHPQLAARGRWQEVDSPGGPIRMLKPPVLFPDQEPKMDAIPALGEHTQAVLREVGYSDETIADWRAAGAI